MLAEQLNENRGFVVDMISPDDNIAEHFRQYRPDVLMINVDQLGSKYVNNLTVKLRLQLPSMPMLVAVGSKHHKLLSDISEFFSDPVLISEPSFDLFRIARDLRSLLMSKIVGGEILYKKLFNFTMQFFRRFGCEDTDTELQFLIHAVVYIMIHPYTYFTTLNELCSSIKDNCGEKEESVSAGIKHCYKSIAKDISDEVKKYFYGSFFEESGRAASELVFIYKTAEILAPTCSTIIGVMRSGFIDR